ncbi:MAG: hypothetical protein GY748_22165, partial [Planctomycetaceae bacterium]|nr:hypothetical protein [Planctomycetaceae bacterium]
MACYINAKKIQRITNERDTNPSFEIVTYIMKLMMGLEERAEEARKDICYLLDHKPDYTVNCDRRFYEEMENIKNITDVAVKKCISGAREFFQNIDDIDGLFASHQSDCDYIIESMKDYTENRRGEPSTRKALTVLTKNLKRRYKNMKTTWSRLIQIAIDYENSAVFHEISEKVWSAGDSVDEAIAEAEHTIASEIQVDNTEAENETSTTAKGDTENAAEVPTVGETKADEHDVEMHVPENTRESKIEDDRAIVINESPSASTEENTQDKTGTSGAEGGRMDAESDRSETNGRERSEVQREHRAEERPSAEERAKETNPQRVDRAGEWPKAEEQPHERIEPDAKVRERVKSDVEEQSPVGAETKEREKSLERLGDAVERQWSSIEKAWDIAITHLPDEQSVRKIETPLKTAEAMLKRAIHTTERMAKEPDKQEGECETNESNQDGERERGCEKNKKQNYVWQPDDTYIKDITNKQQHSRCPDTEGSGRKKIDMDQNINQDDSLDGRRSGNEARIRRVTHKYTPSEIMAATKSKISTKRNSEQNKSNGSRNTKPKTRVTQRTRIKEGKGKRDSEQGKRTNNEKGSDDIDVTEIQTYAQDTFNQRGRTGDIVCITLSDSGASSSLSVQSCNSPVDTDDEHGQCHKPGSQCPDI